METLDDEGIEEDHIVDDVTEFLVPAYVGLDGVVGEVITEVGDGDDVLGDHTEEGGFGCAGHEDGGLLEVGEAVTACVLIGFGYENGGHLGLTGLEDFVKCFVIHYLAPSMVSNPPISIC